MLIGPCVTIMDEMAQVGQNFLETIPLSGETTITCDETAQV